VDAQTYLKAHLQKGDMIITARGPAYFYLLYDKDEGRTPYGSYSDFSYVNDTTVTTDAPYTVLDQEPFYHSLLLRTHTLYNSNPHGQLWFVVYGWKNTDIWRIMECKALQPEIRNFMSRDGVLIFSVPASDMKSFISDKSAWNRCYPDTKPDISATGFDKVIFTPAP
jgi:hypothetical protein